MDLVAEGELDIHSFAFRYACYSEFHWTPETVGKLPEPEAWKLAVMFQEKARSEREKLKETKNQSRPSSGSDPRAGFVEEFTFGEE